MAIPVKREKGEFQIGDIVRIIAGSYRVFFGEGHGKVKGINSDGGIQIKIKKRLNSIWIFTPKELQLIKDII